MTTKIAINGFGRIGRSFLRKALSRKTLEVCAINDLTDPKTMAHLFKYDSVHGTYAGQVEASDRNLVIAGKKIELTSERDPKGIPWKSNAVQIVIESTGFFCDRSKASLHLDAGAKKVLISAPAKDPDITVVLGVNDSQLDVQKHHIISNASCTTNCLAPVVKVLLDNFGLRKGLMTTIHSYTNDQSLLDYPHKDIRRSRAAALSMIPTTTGAAKAVGLVIPEVKGLIDGLALRVPTPNVSLVDLVAELEKEVTREQVNAVFREAAEGPFKGILAYSDENLVSSDFNGSEYSSIFDAGTTYVTGGTMVKVMSWYDNEIGYATRLVDLAERVGKDL